MPQCPPPFPFTQFSLLPKPDHDATIDNINFVVNRALAPHEGTPRDNEPIVIVPRHGAWCSGYSATKQWLLSLAGIPSRMVEVELDNGEHHMVIEVENERGETVVLDNLTPVIGPLRYTRVRTEGADPKFWDAP